MKLSEMTTDQMCDCMADLTIPVANLMEDAEISEAFDAARADGLSLFQAVGKLARKIIPVALRKKRDDTLSVISILTGKPMETLHHQKGTQTIRDAYEIVDEELMDFFKSFGNTGKKP